MQSTIAVAAGWAPNATCSTTESQDQRLVGQFFNLVRGLALWRKEEEHRLGREQANAAPADEKHRRKKRNDKRVTTDDNLGDGNSLTETEMEVPVGATLIEWRSLVDAVLSENTTTTTTTTGQNGDELAVGNEKLETRSCAEVAMGYLSSAVLRRAIGRSGTHLRDTQEHVQFKVKVDVKRGTKKAPTAAVGGGGSRRRGEESKNASPLSTTTTTTLLIGIQELLETVVVGTKNLNELGSLDTATIHYINCCLVCFTWELERQCRVLTAAAQTVASAMAAAESSAPTNRTTATEDSQGAAVATAASNAWQPSPKLVAILSAFMETIRPPLMALCDRSLRLTPSGGNYRYADLVGDNDVSALAPMTGFVLHGGWQLCLQSAAQFTTAMQQQAAGQLDQTVFVNVAEQCWNRVEDAAMRIMWSVSVTRSGRLNRDEILDFVNATPTGQSDHDEEEVCLSPLAMLQGMMAWVTRLSGMMFGPAAPTRMAPMKVLLAVVVEKFANTKTHETIMNLCSKELLTRCADYFESTTKTAKPNSLLLCDFLSRLLLQAVSDSHLSQHTGDYGDVNSSFTQLKQRLLMLTTTPSTPPFLVSLATELITLHRFAAVLEGSQDNKTKTDRPEIIHKHRVLDSLRSIEVAAAESLASWDCVGSTVSTDSTLPLASPRHGAISGALIDHMLQATAPIHHPSKKASKQQVQPGRIASTKMAVVAPLVSSIVSPHVLRSWDDNLQAPSPDTPCTDRAADMPWDSIELMLCKANAVQTGDGAAIDTNLIQAAAQIGQKTFSVKCTPDHKQKVLGQLLTCLDNKASLSLFAQHRLLVALLGDVPPSNIPSHTTAFEEVHELTLKQLVEIERNSAKKEEEEGACIEGTRPALVAHARWCLARCNWSDATASHRVQAATVALEALSLVGNTHDTRSLAMDLVGLCAHYGDQEIVKMLHGSKAIIQFVQGQCNQYLLPQLVSMLKIVPSDADATSSMAIREMVWSLIKPVLQAPNPPSLLVAALSTSLYTNAAATEEATINDEEQLIDERLRLASKTDSFAWVLSKMDAASRRPLMHIGLTIGKVLGLVSLPHESVLKLAKRAVDRIEAAKNSYLVILEKNAPSLTKEKKSKDPKGRSRGEASGKGRIESAAATLSSAAAAELQSCASTTIALALRRSASSFTDFLDCLETKANEPHQRAALPCFTVDFIHASIGPIRKLVRTAFDDVVNNIEKLRPQEMLDQLELNSLKSLRLLTEQLTAALGSIYQSLGAVAHRLWIDNDSTEEVGEGESLSRTMATHLATLAGVVSLDSSGSITTHQTAIASTLQVFTTKSRPRCVTLTTSDGRSHKLLLKSDDLNIDFRAMWQLEMCRDAFSVGKRTSSAAGPSGEQRFPKSWIQTYKVVPLGGEGGLVCMVDGVDSILDLHRREAAYRRSVKKSDRDDEDDTNASTKAADIVQELLQSFRAELLTHVPNAAKTARTAWPREKLEQIIVHLMGKAPRDLLARELQVHHEPRLTTMLEKTNTAAPHDGRQGRSRRGGGNASTTSTNPLPNTIVSSGEAGPLGWYRRQQRFTHSLALMSAIGHFIGLGDRHLDNILVDYTTGQIVHIDMTISFERGKLLKVPEQVPFRLTPILMAAMGPQGAEGVFTQTLTHALDMTLNTQLRTQLQRATETFLYDPLDEWREHYAVHELEDDAVTHLQSLGKTILDALDLPPQLQAQQQQQQQQTRWGGHVPVGHGIQAVHQAIEDASNALNVSEVSSMVVAIASLRQRLAEGTARLDAVRTQREELVRSLQSLPPSWDNNNASAAMLSTTMETLTKQLSDDTKMMDSILQRSAGPTALCGGNPTPSDMETFTTAISKVYSNIADTAKEGTQAIVANPHSSLSALVHSLIGNVLSVQHKLQRNAASVADADTTMLQMATVAFKQISCGSSSEQQTTPISAVLDAQLLLGGRGSTEVEEWRLRRAELLSWLHSNVTRNGDEQNTLSMFAEQGGKLQRSIAYYAETVGTLKKKSQSFATTTGKNKDQEPTATIVQLPDPQICVAWLHQAEAFLAAEDEGDASNDGKEKKRKDRNKQRRDNKRGSGAAPAAATTAGERRQHKLATILKLCSGAHAARMHSQAASSLMSHQQLQALKDRSAALTAAIQGPNQEETVKMVCQAIDAIPFSADPSSPQATSPSSPVAPSPFTAELKVSIDDDVMSTKCSSAADALAEALLTPWRNMLGFSFGIPGIDVTLLTEAGSILQQLTSQVQAAAKELLLRCCRRGRTKLNSVAFTKSIIEILQVATASTASTEACATVLHKVAAAHIVYHAKHSIQLVEQLAGSPFIQKVIQMTKLCKPSEVQQHLALMKDMVANEHQSHTVAMQAAVVEAVFANPAKQDLVALTWRFGDALNLQPCCVGGEVAATMESVVLRPALLTALCDVYATFSHPAFAGDDTEHLLPAPSSPHATLAENILKIEGHRDALSDTIVDNVRAIATHIEEHMLPQLEAHRQQKDLEAQLEELAVEEQEVVALLGEVERNTVSQATILQNAAKHVSPTAAEPIQHALDRYNSSLDSVLSRISTLREAPTAPPAVRDECGALRDAIKHHQSIVCGRIAPLAIQCSKAVDGNWLLLQQALQDLTHSCESVRWAIHFLFDALAALESSSSATSPVTSPAHHHTTTVQMLSSNRRSAFAICDDIGFVEQQQFAANSSTKRKKRGGQLLHICGSPESARVVSIAAKKLSLPDGCPTVQAYAAYLIQEAISTKNLAMMYEGWTAWI